ncbi:hypothetical protein CANINC_002640 [Pichia inconspicua]|uniref:DASH complex subunit ASK1 n=1 Tax=Pichia inconspicua TaxID=52247 RepID=A0A4T0X0P4_9ASCO|nr:hypothetical protein CANINC_002640 [[Candida] inconspicua]
MSDTNDAFNNLKEDDDLDTGKQPRLSFYFDSSAVKHNSNKEKILDEIDRVEQLITINLQKINENLITSNNVIVNKLIPSVENFNRDSNNIYNNINHIKEFFENAANVNILTKKDVEIQEANDSRYDSASFEQYDQKFTSDDVEHIDKSFNKIINSDTSEYKEMNDRYKNNLDDSSAEKPRSREEPTTSTFMKDFRTNLDDESTSKQPVLSNSFTNMVTTDDPVEAVSSENTKNDKSVKDLMSGYESPPWEEPPELQSTKIGQIGSGGVKKRRRSNSNENIETEEDVSIRFPQSPKYGAGGKLLRSEKGRQMVLDYAKTEMMRNHPILSLQKGGGNGGDVTPTILGSKSPDTTDNSSSFEDAPALLSERL